MLDCMSSIYTNIEHDSCQHLLRNNEHRPTAKEFRRLEIIFELYLPLAFWALEQGVV